MLGITYHNPATITVFLDRMRFRDCFVSSADVRSGEWRRKLKQFVDIPSDGRDRVLFVESFATLQSLLGEGADLDTVKVAVYDDCQVLAKTPGTTVVDAHLNGSEQTWQLYGVGFEEFNDALGNQPTGVPSSLANHQVAEDADLPVSEPVRVKSKPTIEEEPEPEEKPVKQLVMEQLLDDIEAEDDDDDTEEDEVKPLSPEAPEPERRGSRVVVKKITPAEKLRNLELTKPASDETEAEPSDRIEAAPAKPSKDVAKAPAAKADGPAEPTVSAAVKKPAPEPVAATPPPSEKPKPKPKQKTKKAKQKKAKLESYGLDELF